MTSLHELKRQVSQYSLLLHERGRVANHDGNVSARLPDGGFAITPTAVSKRACPPDSIVVCGADGKPRSRGRPPSEVALHVGAYRARPKVNAVIHAHPPYASAFALARRPLSVAMPEVVVSLGHEIPLAPMALPKDPAVADVAATALSVADAVLLTANGVLVVGEDLEQAYLRCELVEHYARIVSIAGCIGGVVDLEPAATNKMLELRHKAGLGPKPTAAPSSSASDQSLSGMIRPIVAEEISRVLGGNK